MKLFARLFKWLGIGILVAVGIVVLNQALPFVACSAQLFCSVATCDCSHAEEITKNATMCSNCQGMFSIDYIMTSIFAIAIFGGIGLIWGICDAKQAAAQKRLETEKRLEAQRMHRYSEQAKTIRHSATSYIEDATQTRYLGENAATYEIKYTAKDLSGRAKIAVEAYTAQAEQLKKSLDDLNS